MAVDVSQQAYQVLYDLFSKVLGNHAEATAYVGDPQGYLAAEGIGDYDYSDVNVAQVAQQAVQGSDVGGDVYQNIQQGYSGGYAGGGYPPPPASPPPGMPPAAHVVEHVNYVTYNAYEGDDNITQQLSNYENYDYSTNVDNSVDLYGPVYGDVDIDNVTNTGDNSNVAGGDQYGANTGDNANVAGGDQEGAFNTGTFTGNQAGRDNLGDTAVGEDIVQGSNLTNSAIGDGALGGGNQNSAFGDGAVGGGNVTETNVDLTAADGGAVAYGDGASATGYQDNTNIHDVYDSNVNTGDGYVDQDLEQTHNETNTQVEAHNSQVETQSAAGEDIYQDQHQNLQVQDGGGEEEYDPAAAV